MADFDWAAGGLWANCLLPEWPLHFKSDSLSCGTGPLPVIKNREASLNRADSVTAKAVTVLH